MKNEKITTVFIADTTLEVTNTVKPVTTSSTTSRLFKNTHEVFDHKVKLYDAINSFNKLDQSSNYESKLETALSNNNETRKLIVDRKIAEPRLDYKEVKISDLTSEQKIEFEKLYDMKIVEETFENKVVEFKTKSKVYAVYNNDNSDEAVNVQ